MGCGIRPRTERQAHFPVDVASARKRLLPNGRKWANSSPGYKAQDEVSGFLQQINLGEILPRDSRDRLKTTGWSKPERALRACMKTCRPFRQVGKKTARICYRKIGNKHREGRKKSKGWQLCYEEATSSELRCWRSSWRNSSWLRESARFNKSSNKSSGSPAALLLR